MPYNVPPLDDGRGTKPDDKGLLAAGPFFSRDEIVADFELVKSGEMSEDELLAKYPKGMVGFIEPPPPGKLSLVVDESILGMSADPIPSDIKRPVATGNFASFTSIDNTLVGLLEAGFQGLHSAVLFSTALTVDQKAELAKTLVAMYEVNKSSHG